MLLTHLTWPEVDALDRETPVVVPMAGLVQGGRHLAIGAPLAFAEAVVDRLAEERPDALYLPVLPLGVLERHLVFPGTVAHSFEALDEVVRSTVESFAKHGFRRFFILADPDSLEIVRIACRKLKARFPSLLLVPGVLSPGGGHALTSATLNLQPHLVRADFLADDGLQDPISGAIRSQDEISEFGISGRFSKADPDHGSAWFQGAVGRARAILDSITAEEPLLADEGGDEETA